MKLVLLHPLVAYRSCEHCREWQYDEQTGEVVIWPAKTGGPVKRQGKPPCETIVGCAKGSPTAGKELSEKNWQAYIHYRECRAVGVFPDDDTVRRNAAIIRDIEDARDRHERHQLAILGTLQKMNGK